MARVRVLVGALGLGAGLELMAWRGGDPFGLSVFPGFYALAGLGLGLAVNAALAAWARGR